MSDPSYHPMMRALVRGLRRGCQVEPSQRILLAVSGGADSIALLRAMRLLAPKRRWMLDLHVCHVQHHLRGESSEGDAQFVAELCDDFGLPFHRRDVQLMDDQANIELQARNLRYAALLEVAEKIDAQAVATGQHADDQLETLLLALVRGKSLSRMGGMPWRRPLVEGSEIALIRPMLGVTRDEVVSFLDAVKQPWREDATNRNARQARARLRAEVLPVLRSLNPQVAHEAVRLTQAIQQWNHER